MNRLPRTLVPAVAILLAAGAARPIPAAAGGTHPARSAAGAPTGAWPLVAILCYHDVTDDPRAPMDAVSPGFLRDQIRAAKADGWTFLSLAELLRHRERPESLPARTMVLTFDDGYRSFLDRALPILREEQVKATLAVITSFVGKPPAGLPPLLSWEEIRALDRSGDVEILSHAHDLHRWDTCNPYRDAGPLATTRRYLLQQARYEDRDEYRERIRRDLLESRRVLREKLGRDVPVLVWPFGEHNRMTEALATEAGFTTTLILRGGEVRREDLEAGALPRVMVTRDMDLTGSGLRWLRPARPAVRAAQVDLDDVYDPDPDVFGARVDRLVRRVHATGATHVFLQACPDPGGDGRFRQAWFVNHQVPVRADVWSMVARRLQHAGLKVWIRAPSMNLSWVWEQRPEWRIPFREGATRDGRTPWYNRVSPNLPEVRRAAIDFFTDIAVYLPIDGVLFDDDAYMLEAESLNGSLVSDPATKAESIRGLLDDIRAAVRAWRPRARFGRNVYAPVAERPGVHPGFAQDFDESLRDNDLTVVMAYARMEGQRRNADRWAGALARKALRRWTPPPGREADPAPVMFKFQAYDWAAEQWIPGEELQAMAWEARRAGAFHLGVYPVYPEEGDIPDRLMDSLPPAPPPATRSGRDSSPRR